MKNQQLGQPLGPIMIGVSGTSLTPEEIEMIRHPLVGAVILFKRNFMNTTQVKNLIKTIKSHKPGVWLAVDQEGGRVQRFKDAFFKDLPALRKTGEAFDKNPAEGLRLAKEQAYTIASTLKFVGADFSFAPVLDIDNGKSSVIATRGFHEDPEAIRQLMQAYLEGLRLAGGFPSVAKHFPGHGSVEADTHLTQVVDDRPWAEIWKKDMLPFQAFIEAQGFGIMASHVVHPLIDSLPVGYSKTWIQSILRDKMGYKGIIFSDDLDMAAAQVKSPAEAAYLALEAGCDMILICNNQTSMANVLDELRVVT